MNIPQTRYDRTPYVGQDILYRSQGSANGVYPSVDVPGKITSIVNSNCEYPIISLVIFNPSGLFFLKESVNGSEPGQWHAMPLMDPNGP